jgi:hypothetical protein
MRKVNKMKFISLESGETAIIVNIKYIVHIESKFISFDEETGEQLEDSIMHLSNDTSIYIKGISPYGLAHKINTGDYSEVGIQEILNYDLEIIKINGDILVIL